MSNHISPVFCFVSQDFVSFVIKLFLAGILQTSIKSQEGKYYCLSHSYSIVKATTGIIADSIENSLEK
jgi:hypothetical protein